MDSKACRIFPLKIMQVLLKGILKIWNNLKSWQFLSGWILTVNAKFKNLFSDVRLEKPFLSFSEESTSKKNCQLLNNLQK